MDPGRCAATVVRPAGAVALLLAWVACAGAPAWAADLTWPSIQKTIHQKFPAARELSTAALAEWLAAPDRAPPLLLDARAPTEFAVSHLAGAQSVPAAADALRLLRDRGKDQPVVVYCSIGYRSAALAERLQEAGFTQVQSLAGSIFQWANEGRPVYRGGQPVRQVHPYDNQKGVLLDRALWATTPAE